MEKISSYQKLKNKIQELELKYINDVELLVNGTESDKFMFCTIYNKRKQLAKDLEAFAWAGTSQPTTVEKMQMILDGYSEIEQFKPQ